MSETTYYADSTVRVTSEWIRLGEKIYSIADIKSAKIKCAQPDSLKEMPYFLMILGSITTFTLLNLKEIFPRAWEGVMPSILMMGVLVGLAGMAMLVAQMVLKPQCIYAIRLRGTFGNATPFASDDEQYVNKVLGAIKTAMSASTNTSTSISDSAQPALESSEQLVPATIHADTQA